MLVTGMAMAMRCMIVMFVRVIVMVGHLTVRTVTSGRVSHRRARPQARRQAVAKPAGFGHQARPALPRWPPHRNRTA